MRTRLADILRKGEFAVDVFDENTAYSIVDCRLNSYEVIIVSAELAAGGKDDTVFNSLLAARDFLIFDEKARNDDVTLSFLIHAGVSPEDIIAKVNGILYLNSNVRKSPRIKVILPVEYECEGKHHRSTIQDLSESGTFISTLTPPRDGTVVTVRLSLHGKSRPIVATGHVVYGIGCDLDQSIISHPSSRGKKIIALPGFGITFDQISDVDH